MKNETIGLIQVSDEMLKTGIAGASVSWKLGEEIDHDELCQKLTAAGITMLPEPATPAAALLRVMTSLFQKRDQLVKPVPNPNRSKMPAYGVLPKEESATKKVAFVESWACGLDKDGTSGETSLFFSESAPQNSRDDVEVLYPAALATLGGTEVSNWLVGFVKTVLKGVPTIGGAGTYFIGPEEVKTWRVLREVLHPYGARLYEIPAMRSEQAMECVLESVKKYTETAMEELKEDLQKYKAIKSDPDPKKRTIQGRVLDARMKIITHQCEVVERYEAIFDTKLGELRQSLSGLQIGFAALASGAIEG